MAEPLFQRPLFQRLCIIGLGLIGGSVARAARAHGLVRDIIACDRPDALALAEPLQIADRLEPDPAKAVQGADLVMLCTPVGSFAELGATIAPHLAQGAILTDTGSTKISVLRDLLPLIPPNVTFIPGHPLAGTEHSGPLSGFASLFENRWCLLTPLDGTNPALVEKLASFWRGMGAQVQSMSPDHHDRTIAMVSHLPHLIAFTICSTADDLADETRQEVLSFAASGFRDFTRIAASDPVMWRDIFLNNKDALLEMLDRFSQDAARMAEAVRDNDAAYLEDRIARGRKIRRGLIENKQA